MLKIKELLKLEPLSGLRQINPEVGLERFVAGVGILDWESDEMISRSFHPGDLVMTTLYFAREDESLIERNFHALMEVGVGGIAVKDVFYRDLSPKVYQLAAQYQMPLFLFSDPLSIEEIIDGVREALKVHQSDLILEEKINQALRPGGTPELIREAAQRINPLFEPWLAVCFCIPKERGSEGLQEISRRISQRRYRGQLPANGAALRYQNGILLFWSFSGRGGWTKTEERNLLKFGEQLGVSSREFWIGISGSVSAFDEFHQGVRQSMYAARACRAEKREICNFQEIGIYQILLPMAENESVRDHCQAVIKRLMHSDERLRSSLLETAEVYVKNNGEISKTASELYQHPNTIRYRLQKIRRLIEETGHSDQNFYEHLYLVIRLWELQGREE